MHIHGLAHAASGYHRVLEENRKLYNQVQDLKGTKQICSLHGVSLMQDHSMDLMVTVLFEQEVSGFTVV